MSLRRSCKSCWRSKGRPRRRRRRRRQSRKSSFFFVSLSLSLFRSHFDALCRSRRVERQREEEEERARVGRESARAPFSLSSSPSSKKKKTPPVSLSSFNPREFFFPKLQVLLVPRFLSNYFNPWSARLSRLRPVNHSPPIHASEERVQDIVEFLRRRNLDQKKKVFFFRWALLFTFP